MRQPATLTSTARGFTLVEVLVGLVLGMLAIIIMYQVLAAFEGQRRTTVGSADAQSAGHISLFSIERDVRLAGLGLNYIRPTDYDPASVPLCSNGVRIYSATAGGLSWATQGPVVPVLVTNGTAAPPAPGAPFSDTFVVSYLPTSVAVTPRKVNYDLNFGNLGTGIRVSNAPWLNPATGTNAMFFKDQHILVGQRPGTVPGPSQYKHCVRLKISSVVMDTPGDPKSDAWLKVDPGTGYEFNPPASEYTNFLPVGGYDKGDTYVIPSGGAPAAKRYEVDGNTNQLLAGGTPIAEGVISLQVQYGIGNANSTGPTRPGRPCSGDGSLNDGSVDPSCQVVIGWIDAVTGTAYGDYSNSVAGLGTANAATQDRIRRIKAVRIAVVSRSANLEKCKLYAADPNCPLDGVPIAAKPGCDAAGDIVNVGGIRICAWRDPAGGTAVPLIDPSVVLDEATCAGSLGSSCWDRYRYKVYETVIPLRNVIWGTRTI